MSPDDAEYRSLARRFRSGVRLERAELMRLFVLCSRNRNYLMLRQVHERLRKTR
jgi:hypothetical protein